MIKIKLTPKQMKAIQSHVDEMEKASDIGLPGMLLAQIGGTGVADVGFIDHSSSLRIQEIFGNRGDRGIIK